MRSIGWFLFVFTASSAAAAPAWAVCVTPDSETPLATQKIVGSALSPAGPHPVLGRTMVASTNNILIHATDSLTFLGSVSLLGNVENTPNPVQLDDGSYAVFVARDDGVVSRIDPEAMGQVWSMSVRRPGCASDSLAATPVVHLRRFASDSFKAAYTTDVIYVATRYSNVCGGGTTQNKVYALRATDGTTLWSFNYYNTVNVDIILESPYLDIAGDKLYVAAERTSVSQDNLWAIDVLTGTSAWAANVGSIHTTPVIRGERIYVATTQGEIKALNKDDGTVIWSANNGGIPILTNIFAEFRPPYGDLISAVDALGQVWMVRDDGLAGTTVWITALPGSAPATSRVAMDPVSGKVYVGASDGNIYQLNIIDGSPEANRQVDSKAAVGDASFVFEDLDSNGTFDDVRMIAGASTGQLAKFCTPWSGEVGVLPLTASVSVSLGGSTDSNLSAQGVLPGVCTADLDCGVSNDACFAYRCTGGVCVADPAPDGTRCDDRQEFTFGDSCKAGTCLGQTDCQANLGSCVCTDITGKQVTRSLLVTDEKRGTEVVTLKSTNSCYTIGSNVRAAVFVHLFDQNRVPFTGANVSFAITQAGGELPVWRHPDNDSEIKGTTVSTAAGTLKESTRKGTYFAVLGAPASGFPNSRGEPTVIQVDVAKTVGTTECINTARNGQVITTEVRVELPGQGGIGGCGLDSDQGEAGFLRVRVVRGDTGEPAAGAPVLVGYAKNPTAFYTKYEPFIDPAAPAGDASNFKFTDAKGEAIFLDFGNNLNGPFIVTAGLKDQGAVEFAHVTVDKIATSDVTIVLPVARDGNARLHRYVGGDVTNINKPSDENAARLAVVSQKRRLNFFSGLQPGDLFDVPMCTSKDNLAGENAFFEGEAPWDKTLVERSDDTLQTTYHAVPRSKVFPKAGVFNLIEWTKQAIYEQIGFQNESITKSVTGAAIRLGKTEPIGVVALQVGNVPANADLMAMTMTDYSASTTFGRGAGDVFLQAHGWAPPGSNSVGAPHFDLDDSGTGSPPGSSITWNMAQAEALYLMDPPCGVAGEDERCRGVPPEMRNARTSVVVRTGPTCAEPYDRGSASLAGSPFLELLHMLFSPAGGGYYDACAGNDRDVHGICCAGTIANGECDGRGEPTRGDFMRHFISVKETSYWDPGVCVGALQPEVQRYPYWVFYSPGEGARISVPDLPIEFPRACGGVDTSACSLNTRMGLPTRIGSGASCSGAGDCESGEICDSPDGIAKMCVVKGTSGEQIVRDYEWRAELYNLGHVGGTCQMATPCQASSLPTANDAFNGSFAFGDTYDCLTAQSTNAVIVN
jgi:outer membrane protein assembly factor BamB